MKDPMTELFSILRKENLEEYTAKMIKEDVTAQTLSELSDKEVTELANLCEISFGHKHNLRKLVEKKNSLPIQNQPPPGTNPLAPINNSTIPRNAGNVQYFHDNLTEKIQIGIYLRNTIF